MASADVKESVLSEFAVLKAFYSLNGEASLTEVQSRLSTGTPGKGKSGSAGADFTLERIRIRVANLSQQGYVTKQRQGVYSLTFQGEQRFLNELAWMNPDSDILARERARKSLIVPVEVEALEEGGFLASCPSLPGCHAEGNTVGEAVVNLEDAARIVIELRAREGLALPDDLAELRPGKVLKAQLIVRRP